MRNTNTPYKPVLKDPTDTSHFDAQQTGIPVFSPPKSAVDMNKLYESHKSSEANDEYDGWHFSP